MSKRATSRYKSGRVLLSWGLAHRAEGEITEADDAGAKHHQPKQTIFKNAGEAPGCGRWRTHYIDAKRLFLSARILAKVLKQERERLAGELALRDARITRSSTDG